MPYLPAYFPCKTRCDFILNIKNLKIYFAVLIKNRIFNAL